MNSRLMLLLTLLFLPAMVQAAPGQALKLEEILGLLRTNLADVSEEELSRAASIGLLEQLGSKVQLVTTNGPMEPGGSNAVSRPSVFARHFGYLRVESVGSSLPGEIQQGWQNLSSSNRLRGLIMDLRYARGQDYEGAARTADLFVHNEQPLITAGEQVFQSTRGGQKISSPLVVLVNRQTRGAAEALAAALREGGAALLIGSGTAGEARLFQTFDLSTGQKLRVGKHPVLVGDKPIPSNGVSPDVSVEVSSLDERAYFQDPYMVIPRGLAEARGTNEVALASPRGGRRFNEAELVRRHREGADFSTSEDPASEPNRQVIMDPVLARAVDFLKGLAALRPVNPE